jgi:hypothetical protein
VIGLYFVYYLTVSIPLREEQKDVMEHKLLFFVA